MSATAGWSVVSAEFELGAARTLDLPPLDRPEVAAVGRSNVGKSSLLNAFCGRRGLARVSRTPGRTQLLNSFALRLRGPDARVVPVRWVDLPGYGYAAAPQRTRAGLSRLVADYLDRREGLAGLLLLVDARRDPGDAEREIVERMIARGRAVLICATKADELGASGRGLVARRLAAALGIARSHVLLTSARAGLGLGDTPRGGGLAREIGLLAAEAVA